MMQGTYPLGRRSVMHNSARTMPQFTQLVVSRDAQLSSSQLDQLTSSQYAQWNSFGSQFAQLNGSRWQHAQMNGSQQYAQTINQLPAGYWVS